MLIGYRAGDRAVFLFGFAKSDLDNITDDQMATLRQAGQDVLMASRADIDRQVEHGTLLEIDGG